MKLVAPEKCPFCGAGLSGGGTYLAYYKCGSHIWIELTIHNDWFIKGHWASGACGDEIVSPKLKEG